MLLYDMLLHLAPSPDTRLHRAIAVRYAAGRRAAMAELDDLAASSSITTCVTPAAPNCCVSLAIPARPAPRIAVPSN